jgi:hypothetical protein
MSQENIELVRRAIGWFNASAIDRALEETRDDFEMDWSNSIGPLKGVYRGRQEVLKVWGPSSTRGTRSGGTPRRSSRWTRRG